MIGEGRLRSLASGWGLLWVAVVVLVLAPAGCFLAVGVSPRLFGQGSALLTFANLRQAFSGFELEGLRNSLMVGAAAAFGALGIAAGLAWALQRTTVAGKGIWRVLLWAVLLAPSYLVSVGWEELMGKGGLLAAAGIGWTFARHLFFGPAGVAFVLALKGVPFAYFALAPAMAGVGQELGDAARVHGGGRLRVALTVAPVLAPAAFAGLVMVFAESIGDFGVAATIGASSHVPLATYTLYESVSTYPVAFGAAAATGALLVAAVACALGVQWKVTRGRSYAVLGGRTRPVPPRRLGRGAAIAVTAAIGAFYGFALGVPLLGAVGSSLLVPFRPLAFGNLTTAFYRQLLVSGRAGAAVSSVGFSAEMGLVTAVVTVFLGLLVARRSTARGAGVLARAFDLTLLGAVALPGIVFAAGYIFLYDLPVWSRLGIVLYGTTPLLAMAYMANGLPSTSRILMGPMAQVQQSLLDAARVHGARVSSAWRHGVLPLLSQSLLWAALLAFAATFLELPISELLSPPGVTPVSVAILRVLGKANIGEGTALSVIAVGFTVIVIALVQGGFRIFAPKGWRQVGGLR